MFLFCFLEEVVLQVTVSFLWGGVEKWCYRLLFYIYEERWRNGAQVMRL
jgi:hypothetical protein